MLRRHLSRGGAPVSACAGFDADTASSYLEGALWSSSRTHYEAHLAGCPSCRQHLIGLARLSQLAVAIETPPSPLNGNPTYWAFWKSTVIRWFVNPLEVSSWRWNLAAAGSTIAACAVLIAVFVSQPWRQNTNMVAQLGQQRENSVSIISETVPSPTPEVSLSAERELREQPDAQSVRSGRAPVPPNREHDVLEQMIAPPLPASLSKNEGTDQIAAKRLSGGIVGGMGIGPVRPPGNISQQGFTNNSGPSIQQGQLRQFDRIDLPTDGMRDTTKDLRKGAKVEVAAAPNSVLPNSVLIDNSQHQSNAEANAEERARASQETSDKAFAQDSGYLNIPPQLEDKEIQEKKGSGKARAKILAADDSASKLSWPKRVMLRGLAPNRKADADEQTTNRTENKDSKKFLIQSVRDKIFTYQGRFWVDRDYEPGADMWKVTHILRGSKDFEALLSKEPQLKEFFKLGNVIIVWREEIYRVTDR
jgi:hypothetical protein